MIYARLFCRALILVTLVSCNTRQIALGHLGGMAAVGFLISYLWWENSSKDRPDVAYASIAYGVGGGFGTLLGFYLANALWR